MVNHVHIIKCCVAQLIVSPSLVVAKGAFLPKWVHYTADIVSSKNEYINNFAGRLLGTAKTVTHSISPQRFKSYIAIVLVVIDSVFNWLYYYNTVNSTRNAIAKYLVAALLKEIGIFERLVYISCLNLRAATTPDSNQNCCAYERGSEHNFEVHWLQRF